VANFVTHSVCTGANRDTMIYMYTAIHYILVICIESLKRHGWPQTVMLFMTLGMRI